MGLGRWLMGLGGRLCGGGGGGWAGTGRGARKGLRRARGRLFYCSDCDRALRIATRRLRATVKLLLRSTNNALETSRDT
eukprot:7378190-Prymnesium_polylepis.1